MNRKLYFAIALGVTFALQLALPARTVFLHERVISAGEVFRFRCGPVDPADLFRGRYVWLSFPAATVSQGDESPKFRRGQSIYLTVSEAPDGFAALSTPTESRPDEGPYLAATVHRQQGSQLVVQLPFSRYYIREHLAQAAEQAYRDAGSDGKSEASVTVRVLEGRAVLQELDIQGIPVHDYLRGYHDRVDD